MNNKTITLMLLTLVVIIFGVYFTIQYTVYDAGLHLSELLQEVSQAAQHNEWGKAEELTGNLDDEWERYKYFVMLNYAEEDYSTFEEALARIKGGIKSEDAAAVSSEASVGMELLKNFVKIVPKP